jgi:hypothetical protein
LFDGKSVARPLIRDYVDPHLLLRVNFLRIRAQQSGETSGFTSASAMSELLSARVVGKGEIRQRLEGNVPIPGPSSTRLLRFFAQRLVLDHLAPGRRGCRACGGGWYCP